MRDHRQGNDLAVVWSILRDGKPFILSGKEWKLYLKNMYERKEVDDLSVKGNQIHWTFYGKDQKTTGRYSLILVGNENEKGMITTDTCDFVNVVSCSCKVQNSEDSPNVETETIELTSNLDYVAGTGGGEGGGSYDDTAIWEALEDKVDKEEGKGLSTNDYTDADKQKLVGLANYDDSGIKKDIEDLSKKVEELEQGGQGGSTPDLSEYLTKEEFNEVSERFVTTDALEDYATTQQLTELSAEVGQTYATKKFVEDALAEIPSGESSMFEAIYGETPFADLWNAHQSNKHVVVRSGKFILSVVRADETLISFSAINNENIYSATCNSSNIWSQGSVFQVEKANNKVTSISDKSTDTQYPSAKAVYDFVNNAIATAITNELTADF